MIGDNWGPPYPTCRGLGYGHDNGNGTGEPGARDMGACKFTCGSGQDGFGVGWGVGDDNAIDCGCDNPEDKDFIFTATEDLKHTVTNTVAFNHLFTQGETP